MIIFEHKTVIVDTEQDCACM